MFPLFAPTAPGLEELLAAELTALGGVDVRLTKAGVHLLGELEVAYRCTLWSRLASRILLRIGRAEIDDPEGLYAAARAIPWEEHLAVTSSFAVDFVGGGAGIDHSHFGALRIKDAIVDRFTERCGRRPDVDREEPELRIHAHLRRGVLELAIDLAGGGLHRRGYRGPGARAPLKENLAAALLLRAGWPELAATGAPLVDPCCGAGTLLIEAAWIAGDRAPGLTRPRFGFEGWLGHRPELWEPLLIAAQERWEVGRARLVAGGPGLFGRDRDPAAIAAAAAHCERAGLGGLVDLAVADLDDLERPAAVSTAATGLVIGNLPYGERLGSGDDLMALHRRLGERLQGAFAGWRAALLVGDPELGRATGLRARRYYNLRNGALEVRLLLFELGAAAERPPRERSDGARSLANRLRKNHRLLGSWATREGIACYRLYDSDIPEYAFALDLYPGANESGEAGLYAVLQEYAAPATIDPRVAARRLREAHEVVAEHLELPAERVIVKVRRRQRPEGQYTRRGAVGAHWIVREGAARFYTNLHDYLDTGLYLDHRPLRRRLADEAAGRDVLNLFCYTATATVHAALGGATSTTSVDLSRRYLEWADRNLTLNRLTDPQRHRLVESDVRAFLAADRRRYDLIYVDPPTFSNSKRARDFDIQREHVDLLEGAAQRLRSGGLLLFSTHHRRFRLDAEALAPLEITEITASTIPRDFQRSAKIHRAWALRWPSP